MQTVTPSSALDQIPGTRTTRRIVAALLPRADEHGIARARRAELADLLGVAQGTIRILVRQLERFGLLVRYGREFVFRLASRLSARPEARREDRDTEADALAAFADGRHRAGAEKRHANPDAGPMVLSHARSLEKGALRGVDLMQICRLLGSSYVEDAHTAKLAANNYPIDPKWIGPALDAMKRGLVLRLQAEKRAAEERRAQRAEARATLEPTDAEKAEWRRRSMELIGALGR